MTDDPRSILAHALAGGVFTQAQAREVFERLLSGGFDDAQIAALLALVQARGVSVDELTGAASVMRRHVVPVPLPPDVRDASVIDTCGTGGAVKTFNVSTAAAIVVAAAHRASPGTRRVLVAKHGNRSRTGRGSAEVLAALGVNVDAPAPVQTECLRRAGVCFCFAIHHHPAAKAAAGPRRSLGFPTVFNLLGPLTNPAGADRQLLGVYAPEPARKVAQALANLGATRAMVVHSDDGMDEISLSAPTRAWHVEHGSVREERIDPRDLGLQPAPIESLTASDVPQAARIVRDVLAGQPGPPRDIVRLNAAAALWIAGAAPDLHEGLAQAQAAIDSGAASHTLQQLADASNGKG